jgi:translocator protein
MPLSPSKSRSALALAGFLFVTFCAPALGAFSMPGDWFAALHKPSWNPPSWIFGPAWTLLYTLMAVAAWLVWQKIGFARPLGLYFIQLALNASWTPVFFGAHAMGWALLVIIAMWIAILATLLSFRNVSSLAGWLMVPYQLWVTFATVLNFTLWRLNPA